MGIDQQRGIELPGGAGEFRKHQHAGVERVLRRHILLGDQVHAVVQRGNEADPRGAVEARQFCLRKTPVQIPDRNPVDLGMTPVDIADERGKLLLELAIGVDLGARGHRDLQQRDRTSQCGLELQHAIECAQAIRQAFGIVDAIDPDHQPGVLQARAQARDLQTRRRLDGAFGEALDVDPDRKRAEPGDAVRGRERIRAGQAQLLLEIIGEIRDILLGLEPDQVVAEHGPHQLAMMRKAHHRVADGEWGMEKETDRVIDTQTPQLAAERQVVIVVDPEHRVRPREAQHGSRHQRVDLAVRGILLDVGANQVGARMQDRPQRRIGKTLVEFLIGIARQVDGRNRAGAERLDFGKGFLVRRTPEASARSHPDRSGSPDCG